MFQSKRYIITFLGFISSLALVLLFVVIHKFTFADGPDYNFEWQINGVGYFQLLIPAGQPNEGETIYTRNTSFHTNSEGIIVDDYDNILQPQTIINSCPDLLNVYIGRDYGLYALYKERSSLLLNSLQLVSFDVPGNLTDLGNGLYDDDIDSGSPVSGTPGLDGYGTIEDLNGDFVGYDEICQYTICSVRWEITSHG